MGACMQAPNLCIVTELVSRGSLHSVLHDSSIQIDFATAVRIAAGVARGMLYLHKQSPAVMHRDLKSPNVLIVRSVAVTVSRASWNVHAVRRFGRMSISMRKWPISVLRV